jgi:hypothetical protein
MKANSQGNGNGNGSGKGTGLDNNYMVATLANATEKLTFCHQLNPSELTHFKQISMHTCPTNRQLFSFFVDI